MFDHLTLTVSDFKKSLKFYQKALEPLGFEAQHIDEEGKGCGFGPKGAVALWISEGAKAKVSRVHVAFTSKSRNAVDAFYEGAMSAGGNDHGKPGLRPDYGKAYYAAFVHDPDGNNIEAVTLKE